MCFVQILRSFLDQFFFFAEPLRGKCPNVEFFWSLLSSIRTEYGCEKIQTRKNSVFKRISVNTLRTAQKLKFSIKGFH